MTSTVSTTVRNALPAEAISRYPDQLAAVEAALTERDHGLVDAITQQVVQHFGVPANQVQDQLAYIGMAVRPAAPVLPHVSPVDQEPSPEMDPVVAELDAQYEAEAAPKEGKKAKKGGKGKRFKKLEKAVADLTAIAKRHGL